MNLCHEHEKKSWWIYCLSHTLLTVTTIGKYFHKITTESFLYDLHHLVKSRALSICNGVVKPGYLRQPWPNETSCCVSSKMQSFPNTWIHARNLFGLVDWTSFLIDLRRYIQAEGGWLGLALGVKCGLEIARASLSYYELK